MKANHRIHDNLKPILDRINRLDYEDVAAELCGHHKTTEGIVILNNI